MRYTLALLSSTIITILVCKLWFESLGHYLPDFLLIFLAGYVFLRATVGFGTLFKCENPEVPKAKAKKSALDHYDRSGERHALINELHNLHQIVSKRFYATRVLQVVGDEEDDLCYFLELKNGHVLCLTGRYLRKYEPPVHQLFIGSSAGERKFPCSKFIVQRHRTEGTVLRIILGGHALDFERITHPSKSDLFPLHAVKDGEVIRGKSFDAIKHEWLENSRIPG